MTLVNAAAERWTEQLAVSLPQRQVRRRGSETIQLSKLEMEREVSFIKARCWVHYDFQSTRKQSVEEQEGEMTRKRVHHVLGDTSRLTLNPLQLGTLALSRSWGVPDPRPPGAMPAQEQHPRLLRCPTPVQLPLAWTFAFASVRCGWRLSSLSIILLNSNYLFTCLSPTLDCVLLLLILVPSERAKRWALASASRTTDQPHERRH